MQFYWFYDTKRNKLILDNLLGKPMYLDWMILNFGRKLDTVKSLI